MTTKENLKTFGQRRTQKDTSRRKLQCISCSILRTSNLTEYIQRRNQSLINELLLYRLAIPREIWWNVNSVPQRRLHQYKMVAVTTMSDLGSAIVTQKISK